MNIEKIATKLAKDLTAYNEGRFWKWVDAIGWGKKTTDYDRVKEFLIKAWTPEEAKAFAEIKGKKMDQLGERLEQWERSTGNNLGLSDDGFSDFRNHIIGLGKAEFDAVMKDPQLAMDRSNKGDYKESFSYAIPHEKDFQEKASRFQKWAIKTVREMRSYLRSEESEKLGKVGFRKINYMIESLMLLARGNIEEFLAREKKMTALNEEFKEIRNKPWSYFGIENLIGDVKMKYGN